MESQKPQSPPERGSGPELRLIDRRAFVGFPSLVIEPGVRVTDLGLSIPDLSFPFNVTGGAARFQRKKLDFGFLELSLDAERINRELPALAGAVAELDELKLHFRPGYLEVQARLRTLERPAMTFKVAFDGDGERLALYFYDVRLYGFSATPAPQLVLRVARAIQVGGLLADAELRGANGLSARVLPGLVQAAAVGRGYKMPSLDQARLSSAEISSKGIALRFASGGLPPPTPPDDELLLALEGSRAFAEAEQLLADGKLGEAQAAYLKLGDARDAHPFAVERLLTLLAADPQRHDLALDVAASLLLRREQSATALWVEAVVRERRGESARASERWLALCALARRRQEEASAFFAAESAARAARDSAPQMAVRALHELLGLKPDHLPSLQALARASDLARDRAGAIRAYRRIAALARDTAQAADAHVQLARLCAQTEDDVAGARLHCEAALRLVPDHPDALALLGELCFEGGEHLRAIKALDRLREVSLGRHEVDRIGRANVLAGKVWELGLHQSENALLRYREAVSLLPGEAEPLFLAARVAEKLGKVQEAIADYQQAIELAGPTPERDADRVAAHQSHHALARLHKEKLKDPARAREHLEAALALDEGDLPAIDELLPYFRATGKAAELADACEKAAAVVQDPARRAAFWAEAGELYRGRLGKPERAEKLLASALEADPHNRAALEGMLALAEGKRDGGLLCRCLKALAELSADTQERARLYRRLSVAARDLAFDLELAAQALVDVLKAEPDDLPALGELCALQRRRNDMPGLAWALEARGRAAETHGDKRLAAAALRELAGVLDARLGRVGEALVALEKAARLAPEPQVLLDLANLSLRIERPQAARRALEDLLATMPRHAAPERVAEIRARLGRACELLGDPEAARAHYAAAFPLRRLDDELAQHFEALCEQAGDLRALIDLWTARAQALVGAGRTLDAAPLYFKSAQALLKQGDPASALARMTAALEAAPHSEQAGEILEAMADLEVARGGKLEAAKLFARRAGLATEPRAGARLLLRAADLAQGTGREGAFLQQALERDGAFAPARLKRAELLADGDPRGALDDLEAALAVLPGDPDALDAERRVDVARRAGFAALRAGMLESARRHLALYTAQRPDDVGALRELAALHRRAGAREALCDLLGELWPRLMAHEQRAAQQEHAELCLELGREQAAIDALRSIRAGDPGQAWATRTLLSLLPEDPVHDLEREELLGSLIAALSGDERARLLADRARLHERSGRFESARADLQAAAEGSAEPGPLWRELARLAQREGQDAAELAAWERALPLGAVYADEGSARLLELARARARAGDVTLARRGFELCAPRLGAADARCEAYLGLADAALAAGDTEVGLEALLSASRQGPARPRVDALVRRGGLLEQQESHELAAEAYAAALDLAPRHPESTAGLKRCLRRLEDWEGLAEVLTTEAQQAPKATAVELFAELGALWADRLGQPGPAEAAFRRAAQLDKGNAEVRRRLVSLLAARGELAEAGELAEDAAAALPPADGAALLRACAAAARRASDDGLALRLARVAHKLAPATGDDLRELADLLYARGSVQEALPHWRRLADEASFEENPEAAEAALLRLADLAEQSRDRALAESTLRRLVRERPLNEHAAERLSELVRGDRPRAAIEVLAAHARALQPSERTAARFFDLAQRARGELADLELAAQLYASAEKAAPEPLPYRQALAALYREAARTPELLTALVAVAQRAAEVGRADTAIDAYAEAATLAEQVGRVDEALRTLQALIELCEAEGDVHRAAGFELARARLLRDARLDLEAAGAALERSFLLERSREAAESGVLLAQRRSDRDLEIEWLERLLSVEADAGAKARHFVELARLHLGVRGALAGQTLLAVDPAEAALKESLALAPGYETAERLLQELYEATGRSAELAAHLEEAAARAADPGRRASLLLAAATLYRDKADKPEAAVAALLGARAAVPDDLELTGKVADALRSLGRESDAADFDALVLEKDPFHRVFERHAAHLEAVGDLSALAGILMARAERQSGPEAAGAWLSAARAFRRAGAQEQALLCEDQAFLAAPTSAEAFEALKVRHQDDVRGYSELLAARARAVPDQAEKLLRERAERLALAGESLRAAEAYDDLLVHVPTDVAALEARAELAVAAGGPRASQPFDRRLLAAAGQRLSPALALRLHLRLGHASLESGAYLDAADHLEAAWKLEPEGERGGEALSLLAEALGHLGDGRRTYRATLALARRASGAEAEALYRRAADSLSSNDEALDALLALVQLRPTEVVLVDRAAAGLAQLGRFREQVELWVRSAEAVGGPQGAQWLLDAAAVAEEPLADAARAAALRVRAAELDPSNVTAQRALAEAYRREGRTAELASLLKRLLRSGQDADEVAAWRLELASLLVQSGEDAAAQAHLEELTAAGPAGPGYAQALELLGELLERAGDARHLGSVLAARAELAMGAERAALQRRAAEASHRAGDTPMALSLAGAAAELAPTLDGAVLVAKLAGELAQHGRAARAWLDALALAQPQDAGAYLLAAADAWEAAGEASEARDVLDRLSRETPGALSKADLAARFARLGAKEQALAVGYGPAMQAGHFTLALRLSDEAHDVARARDALWALAGQGDGGAVERLFRDLTSSADLSALAKLSELAGAAGQRDLASEIDARLLVGAHEASQRLQALERLLARGAVASSLALVVGAAGGPAEAIAAQDRVLEAAAALPVTAQAQILEHLSAVVPERGAELLRRRFELLRDAGRPEAVEALQGLVVAETEPRARAALRCEVGQMLEAAGQAGRAKDAYEQALAEDPTSTVAVGRLLELARAEHDGPQLVAMVERLVGLTGEDSAAPYREELVEAFRGLGRHADALRLLGELPETPERLRVRAELADALGLSGEALVLREKLTSDPAQLEEILVGYLTAGLTPFATRLAERLLGQGTLSARAQRMVAERLSPTADGAQVAARLWPTLLTRQLADADGWTLFAEALRACGREEAAHLADGFGAALTGSTAPAATPRLFVIERAPFDAIIPPPVGVIEVGESSMPRLWSHLYPALEALGAGGTRVLLHATGGCEAYLVGPRELVLGAGALGAFGPAELSFLLALALALGEPAHLLAQPGDVPGFDEAAGRALSACQSTLAACRVVAALDARVRGHDPSRAQGSELLPSSSSFRALVARAIELL